MSLTEILDHIQRILKDLAEVKNVSIGAICESTPLLGGELPIDSLDLAALLVQLEALTGYDPFAEGFVEFSTAGELARLYYR